MREGNFLRLNSVHEVPPYRLLARVLKEGVQFRYNDTSTVRGGGGGGQENVPLENL